jgi:hypothetical protein
MADQKPPTAQREPFAVIVEWANPATNANDDDAPFCFGPYPTREAAQAAVDFITAYQEHDGDPPEERLVARIGTWKAPGMLRMFMAL